MMTAIAALMQASLTALGPPAVDHRSAPSDRAAA
jgi:hypothetical protein